MYHGTLVEQWNKYIQVATEAELCEALEGRGLVVVGKDHVERLNAQNALFSALAALDASAGVRRKIRSDVSEAIVRGDVNAGQVVEAVKLAAKRTRRRRATTKAATKARSMSAASALFPTPTEPSVQTQASAVVPTSSGRAQVAEESATGSDHRKVTKAAAARLRAASVLVPVPGGWA